MAEPLAFLLPFDNHLSASGWHALENNVGGVESPRLTDTSSCGLASKMAFSHQVLNIDSLRTPSVVESRPRETTLALESPSETAVATAAGNGGNYDKPSSAVGEKTSAPVGSRPAGNEVASTSYEPMEVSRQREHIVNRLLISPPRCIPHSPPRTLSFPSSGAPMGFSRCPWSVSFLTSVCPTLRFPQVYTPVSYNDMDAYTLFNKV